MRPDEFDEAAYLLPARLRDRVEPLRPRLARTGCDRCREIADMLELALMAARYDELDAAERLIVAAERLGSNDEHGSAAGCLVAERRGAAGHHGFVRRWSGRGTALVAATDASWKDKTHGIGYVVSDGRFGLRGWPFGRLDPTGPCRALINELRAVELLLTGLDNADVRTPAEGATLTVLVDSTRALSYLQRWQAGETILMPPGYSLRARSRGGQPTLVRLAERLPHLPGVMFRHVKGHSGHPLNEAADALSHMARRRVREQFDLRHRAEDLVDAFLRDWHTTDVAAA